MIGAVGQVRTVLGDVPSSELGICFAHEHLIIDGGVAKLVNPEIALQRVSDAVAELAPCVAAGLGTVVDAMPADAGRNVVSWRDQQPLRGPCGRGPVPPTHANTASVTGRAVEPRSWPSFSSPT